MAQISKTAACNRFHRTQARLVRWLLMTCDRVGSGEAPLTHEFLAHMLGLRRVGVTKGASALKRLKPIGYHRGAIRLRDPQGLEALSCLCYRLINAMYERARKSL